MNRLLLFLVVAAAVAQVQHRAAHAQLAGNDRDKLVATIGTLSGSHLYQAYLNVGLLADGVAAGTYEKKKAVPVLRTLMSLLESADKSLAATDNVALPKADHETVEKLRATSKLLSQQADLLHDAWTNTDPLRATGSYDAFLKVRAKSWEQLSATLGLKNAPAPRPAPF